MNPLELLGFAWGALRGHPLRTVLTLLGMAIGVGAVILLTALGEGARGYVTNEFMALGSNLLIVLPGKTETTGNAPILGGTTHPLTLDDAEAIVRRCPRVRRVAPLSLGAARVGYGEKRRDTTVIGSTPDMLEVRHLEVAIGRFLPDVDLNRGAPVAVLGQIVEHELFGDLNPLGQPIRIGDWRFRVVGVMASKGTSIGLNLDDVVIVPVTTSMRLFNQESLFRLMIEVGVHSEIEPARQDVLGILKQRHQGDEDVTILTQDSVLGAFNRILGALTLALAGIAAISLSVAGLGIMNVMLVSVSERTPEIGLLKALGAPPRQILRVFLVEAVLLSATGGVLGLLIGYAGSAVLGQAFPALPAHPPGWAVIAALVVSLGSGMLFGVLPARRAARLDPVVALAGR